MRCIMGDEHLQSMESDVVLLDLKAELCTHGVEYAAVLYIPLSVSRPGGYVDRDRYQHSYICAITYVPFPPQVKLCA